MAIGTHRDTEPLPPGALRQLFHLFFAAVKLVFAALGFEHEAGEVSEVVEDQRGYLAGEARFVGGRGTGRFPSVARRRWRDLAGIAAEHGDPPADLLQVALEDRMPAVV